MSTCFFVYRSKLLEQFSTDYLLQDIVIQAKIRNSSAGVTGFMHVQDLEVLQYLEGGSEHLNEIRESIFRDPRHRQIVLIAEGEVPIARFPDWAMGMASREAVAPLHAPPPGLDTEHYVVFLEVAAARTRRNAMPETLWRRKEER